MSPLLIRPPNVPKLSRGDGEAGDVGCSAMLGNKGLDLLIPRALTGFLQLENTL